MSTIDDGGPAFPFDEKESTGAHYYSHAGMSLRDWFAGQALAGEIAGYAEDTLHIPVGKTVDEALALDAKGRAKVREAMARAFMLEDGCGLTERGERLFCDDERADPEVRRGVCECRTIGARLADAALPLIEKACRPKVKALVWERCSEFDYWRADASFGSGYEVAEFGAGPNDTRLNPPYGVLPRWYGSAEEAKAAAQADYARRILDALEG